MNKSKIGGWALSGFVSAFLIFGSAVGKFTEWEGKEEMFAKMGWTSQALFQVGIVEVVVAILFLIPKVDIIGAILVTAYLGGATATHVRVGDPFYFPIITGILVWLGIVLRRPDFKNVLIGKTN